MIGAVTFMLAATGLSAAPASAASTMSSRYMLSQLASAAEHPDGYERSKFAPWADADRDGCDSREEVLLAEAVIRPRLRAGCDMRRGLWLSRYDGDITKDPSTFDVDHLVPLNEAWQSGAWRWSADTRKAYANDLRYRFSLLAVSAHSNRSKGDREPQDWMPQRADYHCKYLKRWVAVKWRWRLQVDDLERAFLRATLKACGAPRVAGVARAAPTTGAIAGGSGVGDGSTGGGSARDEGLDPRFDYCYEAIDAGYGPYRRGADPEYDWYVDRDRDGIVCET